MFSNAEYCDIHFVYGVARGNADEACRLYREYFPTRRIPVANTFISVHNRLRETGSFAPNMHDTGCNRTVRNVNFEENVLQSIVENPSTSTRAVANELNSSAASVLRVLKGENFYPFHVQKVQTLYPNDYIQRLRCSRWFLQKLTENNDFLKTVLFTDEATFNRDGVFNTRNSHVWAEQNPHAIVMRRNQIRFSVNVWAGVLGDHLVGPYILPNRLNSPTYLVFLRDILPVLLEDVPLHDRLNMWFQHDGCPSHFGLIVREYLNEAYGEQWIGRGGGREWPPRSPDLTPLDFFVWGYMKDIVYSTPVVDEMDLVARIAEAAATLKENIDVFARVRQCMQTRFRKCNYLRGRHFEHVL